MQDFEGQPHAFAHFRCVNPEHKLDGSCSTEFNGGQSTGSMLGLGAKRQHCGVIPVSSQHPQPFIFLVPGTLRG